MHSLTIGFGPSNALCVLLFKTEEKAAEIYNAYVGSQIEPGAKTMLIGSDDFGQAFALLSTNVNGMVLEDMDQSQLALIERNLHQQRAQAKLQQRAANDPIIKQAAMMQGPAVHTPFPNGRFNG